MARRKKPASELTRDELARRVFPKKVVTEAKRIAEGGRKGVRKASQK